MLLVVPTDPLHPRRPDEHFAAEIDAARELGIDVALVDHDAASQGDAGAAVRLLGTSSSDAVYRGWMLRSEHYAALVAAAEKRNVAFRTSASAYRAAHELPGWYPTFQSLTPTSAWLPAPGIEGFDQTLRALPGGPAVIKDYVKSMKHYWTEAAYIDDIHDLDSARRVANRFLELRGEDLVGGIVVRTFVDLVPGEARTWWVDGRCALVTAHPDTPNLHPVDVPISQFSGAVARLGSPFVVLDLAKTPSGIWTLIEVGDGQVSDRPESTPPNELLTALTSARP